jgi:hypothetical protein
MSSKVIILTTHALFLVVRSMRKKGRGKCLAPTPSSFFFFSSFPWEGLLGETWIKVPIK